MLEGIVRYFDLQSEHRAAPSRADKAGRTANYSDVPPKPDHAPVLPQYGAVTLGVLADPLLRNYIESGNFNIDLGSFAGRTVFATQFKDPNLPRRVRPDETGIYRVRGRKDLPCKDARTEEHRHVRAIRRRPAG